MMLGFALAMVSAFGAAFIAEYLDPSFRTPSEVREELNIPVLASFPAHVA
jgi:capsular polysaccharide biosynthesis protein